MDLLHKLREWMFPPKELVLCPPHPDWGTSEGVEHATALERAPSDLVLDAWAFCKAKPGLEPKMGKEEELRRKTMAWRTRQDFIELDCGDDSFFLSEEKNVIAIADGVGGWRNKGVDPSHFANALMGNSKMYADTHREENDPEAIVQNGYGKLMKDDIVKQGSSTVCAATILKHKGGERSFLDVINLGDSGLIVYRNGEQVFQAEETTHRFNFPKQLTIIPNMSEHAKKLDSMANASRGMITLNRGDLVVLATDGYWDNRFPTDFNRVLSKLTCTAPPNVNTWFGLRTGEMDTKTPLKCSVDRKELLSIIQTEVKEAQRLSTNRLDPSPWSLAARKATGESILGGKPDDITLMVARVVARADLERSTETLPATQAALAAK